MAARYFNDAARRNALLWAQMETKIMNEGWASLWHQRILREMDLTSSEAIEFAKLNAGVVQPSKTSINPYYLGIKMFEHIEERYDNPTEEMKRRGIKPDRVNRKFLRCGSWIVTHHLFVII